MESIKRTSALADEGALKALLAEIPVIELTGTDRQVGYARDLRRRQVAWALGVLDTLDRFAGRSREGAEAVRAARALLLELLALPTARWLMNHRGSLSSPNLLVTTLLPRARYREAAPLADLLCMDNAAALALNGVDLEALA